VTFCDTFSHSLTDIVSAKLGPSPARGTASGGHRKPLPVLPQPATETAARASEPWCLRRRTCKAGGFQPRPLADGGVFERPRSLRLGDFIGIGWKGTRIPGNGMLLAMKKAAIKVANFPTLLKSFVPPKKKNPSNILS